MKVLAVLALVAAAAPFLRATGQVHPRVRVASCVHQRLVSSWSLL